METTIKTSFNFAKEIQCNFITKNNPEHSYPGGLPEFITPYLQELQENTIIPDYTTLISITTIDCLIEFSTEQPDSSDNLCEDLSLTTDGITFTIYFD